MIFDVFLDKPPIMRQLQLLDHLSNAAINQHLQATHGKPEFARWQIIYLIQVANVSSADMIAPLVGLSKPSVYSIVQKYNKHGASAIAVRPRGGRKNSLLTLAEEEALLQSIEKKAARGLIKTAFDIKALVNERVGKVVSDDYLWDLFKRHGWKKKMPRPHHPKKDADSQELFKKNSPMIWQPSDSK
jgi:transposase